MSKWLIPIIFIVVVIVAWLIIKEISINMEVKGILKERKRKQKIINKLKKKSKE